MTRILSFLAILLIVTLIVGIWYLQSLPEKQASLPEAPKHITVKNTPAPIVEKTTKISLREVCFKLEDELGNALSHASIELKHRNNGNKKVFQSNETGYCTINVQQKDDPVFSFHHQSCFSKINVSLSAFPGNTDTPQRIILPRKLMIAGTILSGTKQIEGATISIHSATTEYDVPQEEMPSSTQSIQQGQFELSPLPAGDYILFVSHPEYLPHYENCQSGIKNLMIQLRKKVALHVYLKDDQGTPIGGGLVKIQSHRKTILQKKETNVHGSAIFENLFPLNYTIQASSRLSVNSATSTVDLRSTDIAEITLTLISKRFSISGKVLDTKTSSGIPSATVICQSIHRIRKNAPNHCITDTNGSFKFTGLTPDYYRLYVEEMDSYISGNYSILKPYGAQESFTLSHFVDQDVTNLILWLKPSWKISGKVLDENNKGLANTRVSLHIHFRPKISVGYSGSKKLGKESFTHSDGSYELTGNFDYERENAYVFVKASHSAYGRKNSEIMQPKPGDNLTGVNIQFNEELNVSGNVKNKDGEGIPNAVVFFYHLNDNAPTKIEGRAQTDESGDYSIHIDYGIYSCHAEAEGYNPSKNNPPRQITISDNEKKELNFLLSKKQEFMNGFVVTSDNIPVSNAEIHIYQYNKGKHIPKKVIGNSITKTNEEGFFQLDFAGKFWPASKPVYRITAIPPHDSNLSKKSIDDIEPGQKNLKIVLQDKEDRSFEIYGHVYAHDGAPVQSYQLLVLPRIIKLEKESLTANQSIYDWQSIYSPEGEFHIVGSDCEEGPFLICVNHPELGLAASDQIELKPLEVREDVIIQFHPPITIKGTLLDADDQTPVEGARIMVQLSSSVFNDYSVFQSTGFSRRFSLKGTSREQAWLQQHLPRTKSDSNGHFVLDSLPRIPFWLVIMSGIHEPLFHQVNPPQNGAIFELQPILLKMWSRNIQPPKPVIELNSH